MGHGPADFESWIHWAITPLLSLSLSLVPLFFDVLSWYIGSLVNWSMGPSIWFRRAYAQSGDPIVHVVTMDCCPQSPTQAARNKTQITLNFQVSGRNSTDPWWPRLYQARHWNSRSHYDHACQIVEAMLGIVSNETDPPPKKNTHTRTHTHTRKEQTDLPKRTSGGYRGDGDAAIKRSKCLVRENGLTDFISRVVLGGKCSTPLGQVSRKKRPGISHVMHPFVFLFCCLGCLQLGIAWSTCLDGDFNGTCRMLILCFERSEKGLTVAVFGASAKKFGKPWIGLRQQWTAQLVRQAGVGSRGASAKWRKTKRFTPARPEWVKLSSKSKRTITNQQQIRPRKTKQTTTAEHKHTKSTRSTH